MAGVGEGGQEGVDLGADVGEVAEVQVPGAVEVGPGPAGPAAPDGVAAGGGVGVGVGLGLGALGLQVPHPPPPRCVQQAGFGRGVDGHGVGHHRGLDIGQLPAGQGPVDVVLGGESLGGGQHVTGRPHRGAGGRGQELGGVPRPGRPGGAGVVELAGQAELGPGGQLEDGVEAGEQRGHLGQGDGVGIQRRALGAQVALDGGQGPQLHARHRTHVRSRHQPISMISVRARRGSVH